METVRRLLLTAGLSVASPGSNHQVDLFKLAQISGPDELVLYVRAIAVHLWNHDGSRFPQGKAEMDMFVQLIVIF